MSIPGGFDILFGKKEEEPSKFGKTSSYLGITNIFCLAIALYLAFQCKKNGGIDIVQLILAWCCTPFYIVYRLIYPCAKVI